MTAKSAYSLVEVAQLTTAEVGRWAMLLGQLRQQQVSITNGFVIPASVLKRLSLPKASATGSDIELPPDIAQAWLKAYYHHVGSQPAFISISWRQQLQNNEAKEHIQGDANVIEAVLELWAEVQSLSDQVGSIVIQAQPKPQAYGLVATNLGTPHQKALVLVRASREPLLDHGPTDEYKVDVRSWQITDTRVAQTGKPILDEIQTVLAAQAGYRTKLLHLDHGQLDWSLSHEYLTPLHYHGENQTLTAVDAASRGQALLAGNGIIPGVVRGRCVVASGTIPAHVSLGTILVVNGLTKLPLTIIKQLMGVIVETTPTQAVITQLLTYHIPTLVQARGATRRLKTGQVVVLDAARHQVLPEHTAVVNDFKTPKIIFETAQSLTPDQVEFQPAGVLFKPEPTLLESGEHPIHTLRSFQRRSLQKNLLHQLQSFRSLPVLLYRAADFSSADLGGLQYGSQFELPERNPDLGYAGGLRTLTQTELFDFELATLAEFHRTANNPVNLVVSGVRSAGEYKLLLNHANQELGSPSWLQFWLELSTPENFLNFSAYRRLTDQGVIANITLLQMLLIGADVHNQDVYRRYDVDIPLLRRLLQPMVAELDGQPWYAVCPPDHPDCVRLCLELGVAGIITKTYHAIKTKEYLSNPA